MLSTVFGQKTKTTRHMCKAPTERKTRSSNQQQRYIRGGDTDTDLQTEAQSRPTCQDAYEMCLCVPSCSQQREVIHGSDSRR